jgi:cytochrome c553
MTEVPSPPPESADRSWRLWASIVVGSFVAVSLILGFVVLPSRDEARVGPFAALCRALGIPGYEKIPPLPAGPVSAPASRVAWTAKTRDLLASGSATRGAALAKDVCSACHGLDGKSVDPTQFPNLAGQTKAAIYKQLRDFQSGDRQSDVMGPVAQQLNEQQIADAAAYYAGQKPADLMAAASGVDLEIVTLARIGDPRRGIPSCDSCHGQSRSGPEGAPLLLGQTPAYMERQLKNFAARERHNDLYERMRVNARRLTPQEIHSLPIYYSGMPASH